MLEMPPFPKWAILLTWLGIVIGDIGVLIHVFWLDREYSKEAFEDSSDVDSFSSSLNLYYRLPYTKSISFSASEHTCFFIVR